MEVNHCSLPVTLKAKNWPPAPPRARADWTKQARQVSRGQCGKTMNSAPLQG